MKPERRDSSGQLPGPGDRMPVSTARAGLSAASALAGAIGARALGRAGGECFGLRGGDHRFTCSSGPAARRNRPRPLSPSRLAAARRRTERATRRRQPKPSRRAASDASGAAGDSTRGGGAGRGRARCSQPRSRAGRRARRAGGSVASARRTAQAALDASRARKLAFLVRDPSTRIAQASTRGGFLRGERDKIQKELSTLRQLPRPKSVSILSKAPVAKPASGNEYHFELRRNRITFIDLERLMELTRADAQVRIRMSDRSPAVSNKVGPVGAFSLEYELVRAVPGSMEELLERKNIRYELSGWELVAGIGEPRRNIRGDPWPALGIFARDQPAQPRALDGHALGLSRTASRSSARSAATSPSTASASPPGPLPEGMTIRGSPMGTQSAAQ